MQPCAMLPEMVLAPSAAAAELPQLVARSGPAVLSRPSGHPAGDIGSEKGMASGLLLLLAASLPLASAIALADAAAIALWGRVDVGAQADMGLFLMGTACEGCGDAARGCTPVPPGDGDEPPGVWARAGMCWVPDTGSSRSMRGSGSGANNRSTC